MRASVGLRGLKYFFYDVVLKRMFYSQKFVLLVKNAIIHLHPESICFIMYYSKESFIVFFFLVNIVLSPLHQESICFMMSYSKENYIVQNFFSLWTMPYKALPMSWFDPDSILFSLYDSNISNRINLWFVYRISHWSNLWFVLEARITKLRTCLRQTADKATTTKKARSSRISTQLTFVEFATKSLNHKKDV